MEYILERFIKYEPNIEIKKNHEECFFFLSVIYFCLSCTSYEEDLQIDVQDYRTVSPENLETTLKIANLVVSQTQFDSMYTNYIEDIKIDGLLNVYKDGEILIENEAIEVKVKGGSSKEFGLKSIGVKFEDSFDNKETNLINPQGLSFHSFDRLKAIRFRNSGSDFKRTMLKDISYTKLAINAGLDIDLMYSEQTVVFVNDIFLGVMNLRTESNSKGISRLYEVNKDDITLGKINAGGVLENIDGDLERIDSFITAVADKDINYLLDEIDVDNFIDYMIFQSYISNRDWPHNNVRFFAIKEGPFRFIMFDLDEASTLDFDIPTIDIINSSIENPITDLFNLLYSNTAFKLAYDNRFNNLMDSELLSSEKFDEIVTEYKNNIEHMMPTQIDKFKYPLSFVEWYFNVEQLKINFREREDYIRDHFLIIPF